MTRIQRAEQKSFDITTAREKARKALGAIKQPTDKTKAERNFLLSARRSDAGRKLPPHYLVYFLLVKLLNFKDMGKFDKVSWSVPIDFHGVAFLIEHRKFGVGVFIQDSSQEQQAEEIVKLIHRSVKAAKFYFEHLADEAILKSELNVANNSARLFGRLKYFLNEIKKIKKATKSNEKSLILRKAKSINDTHFYLNWFNAEGQKESWLSLAAIDAFFSWTEHTFIHLAILTGKISSGTEVADLAVKDWGEKFKKSLPLDNQITRKFYEDLLSVRKQIRNFVAHGAFGKEGEAFQFHSTIGAVPIILDQDHNTRSLSLVAELAFKNEEVIKLIEGFIDHLWAGKRKPAKIYLQDNQIPLILTMASDGTYTQAMSSVRNMNRLVEYLNAEMDRAGDMDW